MDFCRRPDGCCSTASRGGPACASTAGVVEGGEIPVHYDPMLAKVIASAETREAAIAAAGRGAARLPDPRRDGRTSRS